MKTSFFESPAPVQSSDVNHSTLQQSDVSCSEVDQKRNEQAQLVAQRSAEMLATQGWCLWRCSVLGGDVIAVVDEESVAGIPTGYPVYNIRELEELIDANEAAIRLIHEAKKVAGAKVVGTNWGGCVDQNFHF